MRITVFTDYAFRVLIYLALNPERRVTINNIADDYGISKNHLMKVVNLLANAGLVTASRGPQGGLKLAQQADKIMVGEIIRLTEDNIQLVECFRPDNGCAITPACELKAILDESLRAFFGVLDKYSLQNLVIHRSDLQKLL
ncbi:MAG: Rrf2 family transcriptional regulator [Gammaproteobacteria bacterium]|jgi:Rrf2 family nitric oxide-sensitive transcriptional repressor|nr:BadM/Rrf2 family transcriptional regulator [Chromatiales bacterium]MDP6675041.1 Rrf2 family transcriptional regulator [Gammaproteobacteria bacterium]